MKSHRAHAEKKACALFFKRVRAFSKKDACSFRKGCTLFGQEDAGFQGGRPLYTVFREECRDISPSSAPETDRSGTGRRKQTKTLDYHSS